MGEAMDLGLARVAEVDTSGMFGEVAGLPRQLRDGYGHAREKLAGAFFGTFPAIPPAEPNGLVVCGMGGSAIGADLVVAALPGLAVPAAVVRGYRLPDWVGPETLVVVASYSGQTEESLACAAQARSRECVPVCVSSGGNLSALAERDGLPLVTVPGGAQPRAAVGYLSTALLATLEAAGLCHDHAEDVAAAAAQLEADNDLLGPATADAQNPAKALARRLENRVAVVYGAGPTAPVARRWKGQINENAKAPAFFNELPELDHNELMGWTSLPHVSQASTAVFLHDPHAEERLSRRAELTAREYEALGVRSELVTARGASTLARLFSLVQLGDYVSCYLALLYGVDPTPVDAIQALKASLAGDGD
ncbi:MAG TPA: bifunctional phosphoglucose/phosphomannose isomerase [Thermoleophilia bacterium]|nr:bifunctional phosphoglucose/phosphomannose isomerase [Thermoleophilia bacterium]